MTTPDITNATNAALADAITQWENTHGDAHGYIKHIATFFFHAGAQHGIELTAALYRDAAVSVRDDIEGVAV